MMEGKIPPQDIELEEKILGAILYGVEYGYNTFQESKRYINAECFYKEIHMKLYQVMEEIHASGRKVTVSGVVQKMRDDGCFPGVLWFTDLGKRYMSPMLFPEHCLILYELYIKRSMMAMGQKLYHEASTKDSFEVKAEAEKFIKEIKIISTGGKTQQEAYEETLKRFDDIEHNRLVYIPTGFPSLDKHIGGWNKGDMVVIGTYTSNGKTSFAINTVYHALRNGFKCKFYSFEMNDVELFKKQLALMVDVSPKMIEFDKRYREDFVKQAMLVLAKYPMTYGPASCKNLSEWETDVRDSVKRGVELIVVDYIQLMTSKHKERRDEVGEIARVIKSVANELQVPIIALSQLSRPSGSGKAPPPTFKMLKESGEIEQSSDLIIMPWIPAAQPSEEVSVLVDNVPTKTVYEDGSMLMVVTVPKGRNYGTTKFIATIDNAQKITEDIHREKSFMNIWEDSKDILI